MLIKANNINYGNKDKRVIDSNQAISDRLSYLSEILAASNDGYYENEYDDGFTEGLGAERIDALFADQDGEYAEEDQYGASIQATPAVSQEEIDAIINQANEQANEIIAEANNEAAGIIDNAHKEAEDIKRQAFEEGRVNGEQAGYEEGQRRVASLEEEISQKAIFLQEEYDRNLSELEPKLIEMLTGIYTHVFGVDLAGRSEVIEHLLKNTIREIEGTQSYFVHVSKDDYENVLSHKDYLSSGLASTCVVEIIEDMTLNAGSAFIEADSGIFDCSIDTELNNLAKELRILSYSPT